MVLAVTVQGVPRFSAPIELAPHLLSLIQPGVKQKSEWADLDMHFHVHIPVGAGWVNMGGPFTCVY